MPNELASSITTFEDPAKQATFINGASGTGKTWQYRTLVDAGIKTLYVASEKKLRSISDLKPPTWPVREGFLDYPLSKAEANLDTQDLARVIKFLRDGQHDFDAVYWDSAMRWAEDLFKYLKRVKALGGMDLWGVFADKCIDAIKAMVDLTSPLHPRPVHVFITWGVEIEKDWAGNKTIQPLMDGKKVKPMLPYLFDHMLYLEKILNQETGLSEFCCKTTGDGQGVIAKVSSGIIDFPPIIHNFNLGEFIKAFDKPEVKSGK